MTPFRVYIAGPLATSGEIGPNTHKAIYAFASLASAGLAPYLPHLMLLADIACPIKRDNYLATGEEFLRVCDAVYRMPGESQGADDEEQMAEDEGIPVFYDIQALIGAAMAGEIKRRHHARSED